MQYLESAMETDRRTVMVTMFGLVKENCNCGIPAYSVFSVLALTAKS